MGRNQNKNLAGWAEPKHKPSRMGKFCLQPSGFVWNGLLGRFWMRSQNANWPSLKANARWGCVRTNTQKNGCSSVFPPWPNTGTEVHFFLSVGSVFNSTGRPLNAPLRVSTRMCSVVSPRMIHERAQPPQPRALFHFGRPLSISTKWWRWCDGIRWPLSSRRGRPRSISTKWWRWCDGIRWPLSRRRSNHHPAPRRPRLRGLIKLDYV